MSTNHRPLKTHCKRGHAFTEVNTHVANGVRYCRPCQRERARVRKIASGPVAYAPPTRARLMELLSYDPESGQFRWKVRRTNRAHPGAIAGRTCNGYVRIHLDGVAHSAHRLAWLWMTGEWPILDVDHGDLDRSNNRWSNLRLATRAENRMNSRASKNNTVGLKGVCRNRYGFQAQIRNNGKTTYLGTFETAEAAHAAYRDASIRIYGEFARTE